MADALNAALPEIGNRVAEYFGDLATANMVQASAVSLPDHRPGIAGVLQSSGALAKSWSLNAGSGNSGLQYTANVSDGKLSITLGSTLPYAAIQQYGGAITPTEKMRRFMLAMVIQTQGKDDFWVKMLGHVLHGEPIIIKPTNYLDAPQKMFAERAREVIKALLMQTMVETKN
ncbi:MAG TPA: hypothetical protein VFA55_03720 [Candidatus Kapabacteria bacterium]|nr:hypothetical protein [Candidatus Kapabacteria bacterium]